jgi:carbonic anhydrase/acetyltransferase-like protein (isoleucine patch superfamily)
MSLYTYKEFIPKIGKNTYLAPGAHLIGRVELGENASIWHNCVLRGDVNKITVGNYSNVQDLSMLHVTEKSALTIGNNVTIGHSVTLHGCTIKDNALIGMGATILYLAVIGEYSIVAAGSVVTPGKIFPPKSMIMGAPAKVVRELTEDEIKMLNQHFLNYVGYAKDFLNPETVRLLEAF